MKNNNKNKDNDRVFVDRFIKTVLVIIIIILLLHSCSLIKDTNKEKIPGGNIDIIDIDCDKDAKCIEIDDDSNSKNTNTNTNTNTNNYEIDNKNEQSLPVNSDIDNEEENDDDSEGKFVVFDKNIRWNGEVNAKIFTNSMYKLEGVVAPESSNTYQFIVRNNTKYKMKYEINFVEFNPYNVNMKYKLKKNDTYIIDHYVSASGLEKVISMLEQESNDTYYLEWKWVSSDNDTEIGKNPDVNYNLKIKVKAESVND